MKSCFWLLASLVALAGCDRSPPAEPRSNPSFELSGDTLKDGERLASVLGCKGCHGADLTGQPWIEDPKLAILFASNLTRSLPAYDDRQFSAALREGVRPDGSTLWAMPSEIFSHLTDPEIAALLSYLRTIRPAGTAHPRLKLGPIGRRMIESGEYPSAITKVRRERDKGPPDVGGDRDWARHMIRATCTECHGIELKGDPAPTSESKAPDLVVAGAYSRSEFHRLMRTGEPTGGRKLDLMAMVAQSRFSKLTDREVDAIYDYLVARANRPS